MASHKTDNPAWHWNQECQKISDVPVIECLKKGSIFKYFQTYKNIRMLKCIFIVYLYKNVNIYAYSVTKFSLVSVQRHKYGATSED